MVERDTSIAKVKSGYFGIKEITFSPKMRPVRYTYRPEPECKLLYVFKYVDGVEIIEKVYNKSWSDLKGLNDEYFNYDSDSDSDDIPDDETVIEIDPFDLDSFDLNV